MLNLESPGRSGSKTLTDGWTDTNMQRINSGEKTDWGEKTDRYSGIQSKACVHIEDSKQSGHQSGQSDQSAHSDLSFLIEETLDPWLPIERPLKTLIRLCGCTG